MKRLRDFWEKHPEAEVPLRRWFKIASKAKWHDIGDTRLDFRHADPVTVSTGTSMTIFNVGGNNFRLVARVLYGFGRIYVKAVLTHEEYSRGFWKERI